jgi:hypothetical protein
MISSIRDGQNCDNDWIRECIYKINELVDAVNEIHKKPRKTTKTLKDSNVRNKR